MKAEEVVARYFAGIRAKDIEGLSALYADDATFVLPNGKSFSGLAEIREMHLGVFAASSPIPTPRTVVIGANSVAVEVEARLPDGTTRRTANFYELNDEGRIRRLSVYRQGS